MGHNSMDTNYLIESEDGITVTRFLSAPKLHDILMAIGDVAENYLTELRVWDLSNGFKLAYDELRTIAEYGKSKFRIPSKVAVIVPDDFTYGKAIMHHAYRKDELLEERVFQSEGEAMAWLKSQSKPQA
jgi:hypothetical protein